VKPIALGVLLLLGAGCAGNPESSDDAFARGNNAYDRHDYRGAINAYTVALEEAPAKGRIFNNRGLSRAAIGDLSGALADFDSCLSLPAPLAEGYYNRGVTRLKAGDRGGAVIDLTEAIRLIPVYPRAYAARGLILAGGGDRRGALSDLRRALELAPPDWEERKAIEMEVARLEDVKK
jgi:tetratricopeptide (TPR) repeat protein